MGKGGAGPCALRGVSCYVWPAAASRVSGAAATVPPFRGVHIAPIHWGPGARMTTVEPGDELPVGAPGPVVLRMMLGNQLHQLREAAGVTAEQAGYEIRASRSKISRMESGRVSFKERDAAASSSFSVLRFAEPELPDVAYIELLTTALYLEKREDV